MTAPEPGAPRLKVLIVASWYPRPSSPLHGLFVQQQAEALADVCDVAVLHVLEGESPRRLETVREGRITVARVTLPLPPEPRDRIASLRTLWGLTFGYARACLRAYAALRRAWGRPDIVHGHASVPGALGSRIVSRRAAVPYVITEHQADFLPESPEFLMSGGRLHPWLIRSAMRHASRMIAVSRHLANALESSGYHASPVVVPNIVPGVEQPPTAFADGPGDVPSILHVSFLRSYEKNIPMLLEALRLVDERGHDFRFTFVGDGPDRPELEAAAAASGLLGRRVEFIGAKGPDDVRALFSASAFSVVSSRYETFCMVAAESLAAGRPVVCTRCGGPEDFIDDSVGLLVANDDAEAMAGGIIDMMSRYRGYDPDTLAKHVRDRFAADVVAGHLVDLYREVLGA